jgi:hypothetical protein
VITLKKRSIFLDALGRLFRSALWSHFILPCRPRHWLILPEVNRISTV